MKPSGPGVFFVGRFFKSFIYLRLHRVFVAVHGLSLVVASGNYSSCDALASHCSGFSYCRAQALELWHIDSVHVGSSWPRD